MGQSAAAPWNGSSGRFPAVRRKPRPAVALFAVVAMVLLILLLLVVL